MASNHTRGFHGSIAAPFLGLGLRASLVAPLQPVLNDNPNILPYSVRRIFISRGFDALRERNNEIVRIGMSMSVSNSDSVSANI